MAITTEANPFEKLVKLLEDRKARQLLAMRETDAQLEGARQSSMNWNEDLLKRINDSRKAAK